MPRRGVILPAFPSHSLPKQEIQENLLVQLCNIKVKLQKRRTKGRATSKPGSKRVQGAPTMSQPQGHHAAYALGMGLIHAEKGLFYFGLAIQMLHAGIREGFSERLDGLYITGFLVVYLLNSLLFLAIGSLAIAGHHKKKKSLDIATFALSIITIISVSFLLTYLCYSAFRDQGSKLQFMDIFMVGILPTFTSLITATISANLAQAINEKGRSSVQPAEG